MTSPFSPLSDDELQELDNFLLFDVDCDESIEMMKEKLLACLFKEVPLCYTSFNKPNLSP